MSEIEIEIQKLETEIIDETKRNIELMDELFKSDRKIAAAKRRYLALLLSSAIPPAS